MKIIEASYEILDDIDGPAMLRKIELCGRVCYKSEDKITDGSAEKFVRNLIKRGHESVLEHVSITCRFIVDRGISHELVRHRIAAFSQESTRYVAYMDDMEMIKPCYLDEDSKIFKYWMATCAATGITYMDMIKRGCSPQEARAVLPNSLKTELIVTANLREWRHILKLRTAPAAHPQMREVMCPLLAELKERIPVVFDDIGGDGQWITKIGLEYISIR